MKKQLLVVNTSVANLRKEPVEASSGYDCDDLQETQLIYNECLLYKDEVEDWYSVEAIEQKKAIAHDKWQGYPGWVKKECVMPSDNTPVYNAVIKNIQSEIKKNPLAESESLRDLLMGTRLVIEDKGNDDYYGTTLNDGQTGWIRKDDVNILPQTAHTTHLRKSIIETTKMFLGTPYLWGGRSPCAQKVSMFMTQNSEKKSKDRDRNIEATASNVTPFTAEGILRGVDCSGLTNLACRVNWIEIPRDAHDQWLISAPVSIDALQPADLIFVSAEEAHGKITHVMICLSGEEFIEAFETGSVVIINTFKNKFGLSLQEAAEQDFIVNKRKIYFGSVFHGKGRE